MNYVYFGRWFKKSALTPLKYLGIILLAAIVFLSFAQNLPIPGNFKSLVVMSGSMEPKIHVGSVAIVKSSEDVRIGDVITFKDPRDPKNLITHRVVEDKEGIFKTKGDANNASDNWEISKKDIVGKFLFSVPYLGYTVNFAKSQKGFIFLVIIPATIIIYAEALNLKKEIVRVIMAKRNSSESKTV